MCSFTGCGQHGLLFGHRTERLYALTPAGVIVLFYRGVVRSKYVVCKYMHDIGLHLCACVCVCMRVNVFFDTFVFL